MNCHARQSTVARGLLVAGIVAVALVGSGPVNAAATGTYQVSACDYASGANNSWVFQTNDANHYESHTNCPYVTGAGGAADEEGGLSATDLLGVASGALPGTSAEWLFTAPAGTTISAIQYARYLGHDSDTSNYWSPALRADGAIVAGEACSVVLPDIGCAVGTQPPLGASNTVDIANLSASQLEFGEQCDAPTGQVCVTGGSEHHVWAAMYGATVTISDPTPPTLGTPSGTLWAPGPVDGYHKGTETVNVAAQDVGGGVQSITLEADGESVATYNATCDFTQPQPCPGTTGSQTLALNTANLTDGTHTLTLIATDAANNQSTAASEQITVDNNAPPAPTGLSATGQPGGTTFELTWTNPPDTTAPITAATYQICPAAAPSGCSQPAPAATLTHASVAVPGPGSWTISVWLTDAAGNSDAVHAAAVTVTVPAGPPAVGATGTTGQTGRTGSSATGATGSTGATSGPGAHPKTRPIRLSEHLVGRLLVVFLRSRAGGKVVVSCLARLGGHVIAARTRTVTLHRGDATIVFEITPRAARHASITVTAVHAHRTVTSTLKRTHVDRRTGHPAQ